MDIQDAFAWYEMQSSQLGSEFVRAIDVSLSGIGRNPFAYPVIRKPIRRALIRRFPFGIFYVVEQDAIASETNSCPLAEPLCGIAFAM